MAVNPRVRCTECKADQKQDAAACSKCGSKRLDRQWWYSFRFTLQNGQEIRERKKSPVNTKKAAEHAEWLAKERLQHPERAIQRATEQLEAIDHPTSKEPTLAKLIDLFCASYKKGKPGANASRAAQLKRHVRPRIGKLVASELTQGVINELRDQLVVLPSVMSPGEPIADQTVRNILHAIGPVLDWAAEDQPSRVPRKLIASRPHYVVEVERSKPKRAADDPLVLPVAPDDIDELIACSNDPRYAAMICLAADSGLRIGEIIGVQWPDIADGFVKIQRAVDCKSNKTLPKNDHSRIVPLSTRTLAALKKVPRSSLHSFVFTRIEGDLRVTRRKDLGKTAEHLSQSGLNKAIKAVYRRAGVKYGKLGDNRINVWHSLRHTFGTKLVAKGVHPEEIMRLMGHADYRVTQRYVMVTREQLKKTVLRVFG